MGANLQASVYVLGRILQEILCKNSGQQELFPVDFRMHEDPILTRDRDRMIIERLDGRHLTEARLDQSHALDDRQTNDFSLFKSTSGRNAERRESVLARGFEAIAKMPANLLQSDAPHMSIFPRMGAATAIRDPEKGRRKI